jgi:hypothetical protein
MFRSSADIVGLNQERNMPGARAIVYTANFGARDEIQQPVPQDVPCDFICFTEGEMPSRVGAWRIMHVKRQPEVHPRMQAKRFKLLSHSIFPNGRLAARYAPFSIRRRADLSIWIDANVRIKSPSFVKDMRKKLGAREWAMFVHPWRDCIYEESEVSLTLPKYQGLPIVEQRESYRPVVPPHGGLYACGIIVRREPPSEGLKRVHELWWEENVRWTYQDQISLPFVLRSVGGCEPVGIADDQYRNPWFDIIPHDNNA